MTQKTSISELKSNSTFYGDVDAVGAGNIYKFEDNITITGHLNLAHAKFDQGCNLPKGLKVGGWLNLLDARGITIPVDMEVEGTVYLDGTEDFMQDEESRNWLMTQRLCGKVLMWSVD